MRMASNCRHVSGSDDVVTLLRLLCWGGRPGRLIGCHITGGSATGNGTDFLSKKRSKALLIAQKKTHYQECAEKKTMVGAARQNQAYVVLRHSMRKHREKLSSLNTTGVSIAIPLSNRYYNLATVWLQGLSCLDICTNFFDNCLFCMLQLYELGLSLSLALIG